MSPLGILAGAGILVLGTLVVCGARRRRRLLERLRRDGGTVDSARSTHDRARAGAGDGMARFVRPYRGALTLSVLLALIETLLALGGPWPLKLIIDNALGGRPLPLSLPLVGGMKGLGVVNVAVGLGVGLVVAAATVSYVVSMLVGTTALNLATDLRAEVFARLLHLPARVHDRHSSGDLVTRLTSDVSRVQEALVARVQVALPGLVTMAGMTTLMLLVDPTLTLVVLGAIPPLALVAVLRRRSVAAVQAEARTRAGVLASHAAEVIRHARAVQTFSQEDPERRRFGLLSRASAQAAGGVVQTSARLAPTADLLFAVVLAGVLWLGTARVVGGRITLGELMVFVAYLGSMRTPIRSLSALAGTLGRGKASRERLAEVLAEPPLAEPRHPLPAPAATADLRLANVSFGYAPGAPVLIDVTLTVPAGRTVCVVGKTGAGKSTLLSLLVRLHDPDSGVVSIGDTDVRQLALADVRARAAFVPQDAWVMAGTIADNVRYGTPGASDEAVRAACASALVDEFADRLPAGLQTPVGEGGTMLSGGQRRRVALARALLRGSPVLLLDEPTSGLDAASEALVIEAIARASVRRTVVIVTHQLALAERADRVVVLAGGEVVQSGPPAALRRDAGGEYARLLRSQRATSSRPPHPRGTVLGHGLARQLGWRTDTALRAERRARA